VNFFFLKRNRLLKPRDFRYTEKVGCRKKSPHFVLLFKHNLEGVTRLGLTVSRKNGNAVKRNYIKRFLREFFRLNQHNLKNFDFVLIVRRPFTKQNTIFVKNELDELFSIK